MSLAEEAKADPALLQAAGRANRNFNATFINMTLGADNDIWQHRPTRSTLPGGPLAIL
jgi:hypothetical protein